MYELDANGVQPIVKCLAHLLTRALRRRGDRRHAGASQPHHAHRLRFHPARPVVSKAASRASRSMSDPTRLLGTDIAPDRCSTPSSAMNCR
jgi:hypothetical protein